MPLLNFPHPRLLSPKAALMNLKLAKDIILKDHPHFAENLFQAMRRLPGYNKTNQNTAFAHIKNIANHRELLNEICIRIVSIYRQYFDEIDCLKQAYKEHTICLSHLENESRDAAVIRDYWLKVTMATYEEALRQACFPILCLEMR